jgi:hypothetical protein
MAKAKCIAAGTLRREAIIHLCQCWDSAKPHHSPPRTAEMHTQHTSPEREPRRSAAILIFSLQHSNISLWRMDYVRELRARTEHIYHYEIMPLCEPASEWCTVITRVSSTREKLPLMFTLWSSTQQNMRGGVIKMLRCLIDVQKVSTSPCASFFTSQNFRPRDLLLNAWWILMRRVTANLTVWPRLLTIC